MGGKQPWLSQPRPHTFSCLPCPSRLPSHRHDIRMTRARGYPHKFAQGPGFPLGRPGWLPITCPSRLHWGCSGQTQVSWPCGLMDKALVFGTKDCRFESCQGHCVAIRRQPVVPAFGWSFRNRAARARHLACVCRRALPHLQSSGAWLRSSCRSAAQTGASAKQLRSKLGSLRAKGTPGFEPGTC